MKKVIKKIVADMQFAAAMLCASLFTAFGCGVQMSENQTDEECIEEWIMAKGGPSMDHPLTSVSCGEEISFIDAVSRYSRCSNVYLIKGIALDAVEYGRNIRFVEDLKGNFPKNVSTFIAWGGGHGFITLRIDNLAFDYDNHDTLILLLLPATDSQFKELPTGYTWFEKTGDFCLLPACIRSVLKLSDNGDVSGSILSNVDTMPWSTFQKHLKKSLKNK